ncbi:MAG: PAS domain S-box protein [Candidatus Kapaibacterium sp.]
MINEISEPSIQYRVNINNMSNEEIADKIKQLQKEKSYFEALSGQLLSENKKLERMLDKYLRLFYDTPVGYITIDESGVIRDANRAFLDTMHAIRDNAIGAPITNFLHKDSMPAYNLFFENIFLSGNPGEVELRLVRPDGEDFDARLSGNLEHTSESGGLIARITAEDISERKQREQQIIDSEENYRVLIEHQDDYLLKIATNGQILFASPSFCDIFRTSEAQLREKNILDFVAPGAKSELAACIESLGAPPFRKYFDMPADTPSGRIYISWACKSVLDSSGRPVAHVGVGRDITRQKMAEQKLRESEATARALINAPTDFVVLVDRSGDIISGNKVAARKFDIGIDDLEGRFFFDYFNNERRDFLQDLFEEVIKSGKSVRFENQFWSEWYDVVVYPIIDGEHASKVAFVARDISIIKRDEQEMQKLFDEIARSEQKLSELNESKDKFFSIISHDLKSPLQSLMLVSNMLRRNAESLSREDICEYADDLNNTAGNLYKLLENLLHWSRIQRGAIDFNPESFALRKLADESINIVIDAANRKKIEMSNNIPPDIIPRADINMTNTVLRNLLSNAIKFTPEGGSIMIEADDNEDMIEVRVVDSGRGMPPEILDSLFRIGRQTTTPGTNDEKGSGIGLILCRELVEKQGGQISASSAEGEGSTFRFTLPKNK